MVDPTQMGTVPGGNMPSMPMQAGGDPAHLLEALTHRKGQYRSKKRKKRGKK